MRNLLLTAFAVVASVAVFAQTTTTMGTMNKKAKFGLDVGVNLADFDVDASHFANPGLAPSTKSKTSYHIGTFIDIPIGGIWSLKPQVIYSKQGAEITQMTQSGTGTTTTNYEEDLDYLYIAPAALHLTTRGGFIAETGPLVGFLLGGEQSGPAPYNRDIKDMRNKVDVVWSGGIGYLLPMGLGAHVRYNYGLSNVMNNNNSGTGMGKMQNRVVQIGLMYHFGGRH